MIGLIVAYSKNRVIGKDGQIPWRIKGEQKRFRELTTGNVVIMGRRSYEEIGKPLPNRYTIVVSNTKKFEAENCTTVGSLQEAIEIADKSKNIYISGGAGLYKEAIDMVDKMFITEIDAVVEGDTYFPEFDTGAFEKEIECHVDGDMPYDYVTYTRKQKGKIVTMQDVTPQVLDNGVVRTIKGYIQDLMVVELKWQKGMEGAVHTHPHRQCGYIIKGSFEANLDGEKKVLSAGECFYVEAGVPHGLIALEDDSLMLDIFTPMREDFIS